jgi:hypothetical protein
MAWLASVTGGPSTFKVLVPMMTAPLGSFDKLIVVPSSRSKKSVLVSLLE